MSLYISRVCMVWITSAAILGFGVSHASTRKDDEARELAQRALDLSYLEGDPSERPFHLKIRYKLSGFVSGTMTGHYLYVAAPDSRWRREIAFSDYSQIEVGNKERIWTKRSLPFTPKSASWVKRLLGNYIQLTPLPQERVDRVFSQSRNRCIEMSGSAIGPRILCFGASGNLSSVELPAENTIFVYRDYAHFGKKYFPHALEVVSHGRSVVDAQVEDLAFDESPVEELLVPPRGAAESEGCRNPTPGRLIDGVAPEYPTLARSQGRSGTVTISAMVGKDGKVHDPVVIQTAGKDFDNAAMAAVSNWRFTPFKCGNNPINSEIEIPVSFWRGRP